MHSRGRYRPSRLRPFSFFGEDVIKKNEPSDDGIFTWQIPSVTAEHSILLCNGYTRMNCNKYVILPIIQLFAEYFTNESYTLQDIKKPEGPQNKQYVLSPTFSLCSFKWKLELWPDGSTEHNKGAVILFLCLASCPPNLEEIETSHTLSLKEKPGATYTRNHIMFTKKQYYRGWPRWVLLSKDIQDLKQLTFTVQIRITDILNKDGKSIYNTYFKEQNMFYRKPIQLPFVRDKWTINHKNATGFCICLSEVYQYGEFKWFLKLHHFDDGKMRLYLIFIPFLEPCHAICVDGKINLDLKEIKIQNYVASKFIIEKSRGCTSYIWWNVEDKNDIEQILKAERLNIYLNLVIVDVFDENKDVIQNYIENHASKLRNTNIKLPVATYKWSVTEPDQLKMIKNAAVGQEFQSDIFILRDLMWYIKIFPNGNIKKREGKFRVFLELITLPPTLSQVVYNTKIIFNELKVTAYDDLNVKRPNYTWNTMALFEEIKDLETITISLELTILEVYDKNGDVMTDYIDKYQFKQLGDLGDLPWIDHKWTITDKNTLQKIKNAPNVSAFASPPFLAFGEVWYLTIYPNGSRTSRSESVNIFLNWISMETTFAMKYELEWVESGKTFITTDTATNCADSSGSTNWPLSIMDLDDLDTITIRIKIKLLDVYKNKEIITDQYMDNDAVQTIETPLRVKVWRITEAALNEMRGYPKGVSYTSDMFEMYGMSGWYLEVFPKGKSLQKDQGVTVCINIVSLPSSNAIISARYKLMVKELGIAKMGGIIFKKHHLCKSWGPERMSCEQFNELKECTIELRLELLNVYDGDDNNNNIHNAFIEPIDDNNTISEVEELDQMIKKMNVLNELQQQREKTIGDRKESEYKTFEDDSDDALELWLFNDVKLPEYYDVFITNNIDNMTMIKMVSMSDLDEMEITNIGHKLQIWIEITKLCQNDM